MNKLDFFSNVGGVNVTDSPFYVNNNQATGGFNYEYTRTGGLMKRRGDLKINSSADSDTQTLGLHTYNTKANIRSLLRASDIHLQTVNIDTSTFTNVTEDTAAVNSTFFSTGSTQPVVFSQFNPPSQDTAWFAGGGASTLYGYNGTKVTQNGTPALSGTFSGIVSASGGSWTTTGTYYYAVAQRKSLTQAISNATLDFSATIANVTDKVTITLPTISDQTKYDKFYIYRSAVGGTTSFTTGVLVAIVDSSATSYVDTGSAVGVTDNVPRADYAILDNSVLPSGTYNNVVTWKNQLVTAKDNTVYISDFLKPESWPSDKNITLTDAGQIQALGVVNFNSRSTSTSDEYLVVWTTTKMYIIQGTGFYDDANSIWDLSLFYIDAIGCVGQASVVNAYGSILWVDLAGIYSWDANGKPVYISRFLEGLFNQDGDFDRTNAKITRAKFFRKQKQIHWYIPHRIYGENKVSIVLDGRLTYSQLGGGDSGTSSDAGIFYMDNRAVSTYGVTSYITSNNDEYLIVGDDNGFLYNTQRGAIDQVPTSVDSSGEQGIEFDYYSNWTDCGMPGIAKRYHKVVVYVESQSPDNLTLEYWTDYKVREDLKSTRDVSMDSKLIRGSALWDVAFWDDALWDDYEPTIVPITFNLDSKQNNNEGDAIRLRFKQYDESVPVVILGWSLYWSEGGLRK